MGKSSQVKSPRTDADSFSIESERISTDDQEQIYASVPMAHMRDQRKQKHIKVIEGNYFEVDKGLDEYVAPANLLEARDKVNSFYTAQPNS